MTNERLAELVGRHWERAWGRPGTALRWTQGRMHVLGPRFVVLRFEPSPTRRLWTYATCGMSQVQDDARVEAFLLSPVETQAHVELLAMLASFHRADAKLGLGHTVNLGRPWLPGSACDHGVLSLPYTEGPSVEDILDDAQGVVAKGYWLLPITRAEREFKKAHGLEALEQLFESQQFNYLNPDRASVV